MRRVAAIVAIAGMAALQLVLLCAAAGALSVGAYSQQNDPGHASAGGSVSDGRTSPGGSGPSATTSPQTSSSKTALPSSLSPSGSPTGSSPTDSEVGGISGGDTVPFVDPNFRGGHLKPPGDAFGRACLYFPAQPGACPAPPAPPAAPRGRRGRGRAPPSIDPFAVAQSIADHMPLLPGDISANPSASGWTGVPSWFWLDPPPRRVAAVAVLGAEQVVVTAVPSPEWQFGDGDTTAAGVGRPYERGGSTEGTIRHRYETRCLPGDRGRNPYVLASCSDAGYQVTASVSWTITFVATGPVPAGGGLPARTTTTSLNYAVSELRAFLTANGGPS